MKDLFILLLVVISVNCFAVTRTWVGTTTSYTASSNWSPSGSPGSNDDLIINTASAYPVLTASKTVNSIKFAQAGANITILPGRTLTVKEKIENTSGSPNVITDYFFTYGQIRISHGPGIVCDLIGDMVIPQIDVSSDAQIVNGDIEILEWLYVTSGSDLDVNTGTLTTLASASQTAYIHQDVGTTITGDVTIQQYVHAEDGSGTPIKTYHSISSPCQSQTVGDIADDATTWNLSPSNVYPFSPSGVIPDILAYNETVTDVSGSDVFYGYYNQNDVDNNTDPLIVGKGYFTRIKPVGDIIDWTGPVNGPMDYTTDQLTFTNNGESYDGAHLIGNPFPEPIDWNNATIDTSSMKTSIFVWKNNGTEYYGAYATYDQATGAAVNAGDEEIAAGVIAIGQGFFIKVLSTATQPFYFDIEEATRIGDNYTVFYKDKPVVDNKLGLMVTGQRTKDETLVMLMEDGDNEYNEVTDMDKMRNPTTNLYTAKTGKEVSINKLRFPEQETLVPLALQVFEPGSYTFSVSQSAFTDGYSYFFEDKANNIILPVEEDFNYSFEADQQVNDRFSLRIVNNNAKTIETSVNGSYCFFEAKKLNLQLVDRTIDNAEVQVMNLSGQVLFKGNLELNNGRSSIDMSSYVPGVYLINMKHAKGTEVQKVLLK